VSVQKYLARRNGLTGNDGLSKPKRIVQIQKYGRLPLIKGNLLLTSNSKEILKCVLDKACKALHDFGESKFAGLTQVVKDLLKDSQ
jgi:hypothetical protein